MSARSGRNAVHENHLVDDSGLLADGLDQFLVLSFDAGGVVKNRGLEIELLEERGHVFLCRVAFELDAPAGLSED